MSHIQVIPRVIPQVIPKVIPQLKAQLTTLLMQVLVLSLLFSVEMTTNIPYHWHNCLTLKTFVKYMQELNLQLILK